ncbi:MAG: hypothetical protein J6M35_06170 [Clostridia bacterium]|nr:hypothetical protein [Clostridia bacterium]
MKKLISLIMALITIVMCITSCSSESNNEETPNEERPNEETPNEETPMDENKPVEYIFFYSPGQSASSDENVPSSSTGFVHINDYGVNHGTKSEKKVFDELKGATKIPFEGSGTFVYDYSDCQFKTNKSDEYGDFYSIYDRYKGNKSYVNYLHGTDILTCYVNKDALAYRNKDNKTMAAAECKRIAEKFISNILTPEEFSKFNEGVFVTPFASNDGLFSYHYTRFIGGYATDEYVYVVVTADGEIAAYVAHNFGKYDTLISKLTKEKIDAAKEKLENKIEELELPNLSMTSHNIVTNTSGDAFLRITIEYGGNEGFKAGDSLFINILNLQ